MTDPDPKTWTESLQRFAITALLAAAGLYMAATLIMAIAHVLIALLVVAAIGYGIYNFERYRRSRW